MVTFFKTPGGEELAILPRDEYEALAAARDEERADIADARAAFAAMDAGLDEGLTAAEVEELANAPSPLAFWMKKRDVTQAQLASTTHLSQPFVSKLARGETGGSIETMRKIAEALGVTVDDLTS
jgi:predicted XRE-type DNA-binding protein